MSIPLDISLEVGKDDVPAIRFVKLILSLAIQDNADEVTFTLDLEAESKVRAEQEQLRQRGNITEMLAGNHPKTSCMTSTFSMIYQTGGRQQDLPPAPGSLFEPAMRILLNAAGIPYWTKGEVAGEFETLNPASKWRLSSPALDQSVRLQRLTAAPGRE